MTNNKADLPPDGGAGLPLPGEDGHDLSAMVAQTDFFRLSDTLESIAEQYPIESEERKAITIGHMAFVYVKSRWGLDQFKQYLHNLDREPTVQEVAAYQIMGINLQLDDLAPEAED